MSTTLKGLIGTAAQQDEQIALLWRAIERLADCSSQAGDCVPCEAALQARFEAESLRELVER